MTIRNIITAGTLSALVGISGIVSSTAAFADDADFDLGVVAQSVQVVDAEFDYSFEGDSYIDHGDVAEDVNQVEEALLLDGEFDALEIN